MVLGLSNPTIEINDQVISIVPNSYESKPGIGDLNARSQSAGAGQAQLVVTENAETKMGMVKFQIYNTDENLALLDTWLQNSRQSGGNTIRASESNSTTVEVFTGAVITTEPTRPRGADVAMDIEFYANPIQV